MFTLVPAHVLLSWLGVWEEMALVSSFVLGEVSYRSPHTNTHTHTPKRVLEVVNKSPLLYPRCCSKCCSLGTADFRDRDSVSSCPHDLSELSLLNFKIPSYSQLIVKIQKVKPHCFPKPYITGTHDPDVGDPSLRRLPWVLILSLLHDCSVPPACG